MNKNKEKNFFAWVFSKPIYWIILFVWFVMGLSDINEAEDSIVSIIFYLIIMGVFLLIPFAVYRMVRSSIKRKTFPNEIKSWRWIIYITGLFGVISPIFWLVQLLANFWADEGEGFFSKIFHKITYILGWVTLISLILVILVIIIFDSGIF